MLHLFAALAALVVETPAAAAPAKPEPISLEAVQADPDFRRTMDHIRREGFRRGPTRADWSEGGIDVEAALEAEGGGGALLVGRKGDGDLDVVTMAPVRMPDLVGPGFVELASYGDIDAAVAGTELTVGTVDRTLAVAMRIRMRRVGSGYCGGELLGVKLYRLPGRPELDPQIGPFLFASLVEVGRDLPYCLVWKRTADGGFTDSSFLPDGASLPALDEREIVYRATPVASIDRLLDRQ